VFEEVDAGGQLSRVPGVVSVGVGDHRELVGVFMGSDAVADAGRGLEEALVIVVWGFF
jgi:hypothetical protein